MTCHYKSKNEKASVNNLFFIISDSSAVPNRNHKDDKPLSYGKQISKEYTQYTYVSVY